MSNPSHTILPADPLAFTGSRAGIIIIIISSQWLTG
jgi:hypothetical protein